VWCKPIEGWKLFSVLQLNQQPQDAALLSTVVLFLAVLTSSVFPSAKLVKQAL
jgi:hypothetical protein